MSEDVFESQSTQAVAQALTRARTEHPVRELTLPNGARAWHLTRYDDIRQAFSDPRLIKRPSGRYMVGDDGDGKVPEFLRGSTWHMLNANPPQHTRLRRLVSRAFTHRRIQALEPRIQQITDELLDRMKPGETVDLIEEYAFPIPIQVICALLGVPLADEGRFREWSTTVVSGAYAGDDMVSALKEFVAYNKELIAHKRASPGDDLLSELAVIPADDDRLSEDELSSMIFLLLIAGHETTVNLIGSGCHSLMANPDQAAELRAKPELLPNAVEEILRFTPPVKNSTVRVAAEPVEYGGQTIPAGSVVLLSMMSANHDPDRFEAPDEFDIHRADNQHVAFGYHLHLCLGAPLARMEARIAIGSLLTRFDDLTLAVPPETLTWRPSVLMHGLDSLPTLLG